jgi:hypothetical protein
MFFKKHKGSAFISLLLIASAIISLIAISTARLNSSFNSTFNANSRITSAEQFALSSAAILQATNYDDLVDQPRHSIPNTKYSSAVTLGAEQNLENDVKMRPAEISVYYGNDAEALYTLSTRLYKLPPESLIPVGMIIAWASAKNPDDETWLECNGQSCAAYPKLVAVLGRSTVPDYRGVFLRGYGSRTSSHYGTVTHQSGALGELQGDAIRNITGSMATSMSYADGKLFQMSYVIRTFDRDGGGPVNATSFDASRVIPTANENRPINMAVRYFIKAS